MRFAAVIQACDVDPSNAQRNGQDREEDQTVSERLFPAVRLKSVFLSTRLDCRVFVGASRDSSSRFSIDLPTTGVISSRLASGLPASAAEYSTTPSPVFTLPFRRSDRSLARTEVVGRYQNRRPRPKLSPQKR
jgi:hypothetical protein